MPGGERGLATFSHPLRDPDFLPSWPSVAAGLNRRLLHFGGDAGREEGRLAALLLTRTSFHHGLAPRLGSTEGCSTPVEMPGGERDLATFSHSLRGPDFLPSRPSVAAGLNRGLLHSGGDAKRGEGPGYL